MMGKTSKEKEEGTRILNNYKKQLKVNGFMAIFLKVQ
jgi:hypothetical protein